MIRIGIEEQPKIYFLYNYGYTEIGLEFSHRLVVLFVEPHMGYGDAVKKYREISESFGIEMSEEEITHKWIKV